MLIVLVGLSMALAGCSIPDRGPVVPYTYTELAQPLGIPNLRFYADGDPAPMIEEASRALAREKAALQAAGQSIATLPPAYYLAVSGGGDNGAFGAGLMNGWTATGTRPSFKMVTGVSTGALIAPFAFLGPDHDAELREVYTTLTPDRIFRRRSLAAALFNDAMADTTPLAEVIAKTRDEHFNCNFRGGTLGRLALGPFSLPCLVTALFFGFAASLGITLLGGQLRFQCRALRLPFFFRDLLLDLGCARLLAGIDAPNDLIDDWLCSAG